MRVLLMSLLLISTSIYAQTPEQKGLEIATEADRRDTGWGDQTSDMKMILYNRQGQSSERQMRNRILEVQGDGDKSMIIFDFPHDVKGTAFLTHSHPVEADDQWLYLPALKRIKRISSNNKSGPFMGSEFAYEDLSSQEVEKYTYRFIKHDTFNGRKVFVIERIPAYEHSGYKRQVALIDQDIYRPLKIDFYDRKNTLLKTLTLEDYQQYLDKYWRASKLVMVNRQSGKSTELLLENITFNNNLTELDFNRNSLKRIR